MREVARPERLANSPIFMKLAPGAIDLEVDFNLSLAPSAIPEPVMIAFQPLQLPNGTTLSNRIAKAAMEENLAAADQGPSDKLLRLYRTWAEGGAGLLLTGNVMIDRRAMTGPGGVALEDDSQLQRFRDWAHIGRSRGAQFWMQLNHPGRQRQANRRSFGHTPGVGRVVQAVPRAEGIERGGNRRADSALRPLRRVGRAGRLFRRADPCSARLPAQPVSLAADQ